MKTKGNYSFEVGDKVTYVGTLYDFLRGKEGKIENKEHEDSKNYYTIRFFDSDKTFVLLESVIILTENAEKENVNENN